jgi:cytochrome c oxidase cbb3-type subunit 3
MKAAVLAFAMALLAASGCDREARRITKDTEPALQAPAPRAGLQPGEPGPGLARTAVSRDYDEANAYEISEGKRLFRWYNCNGCHGAGGGGMGPPLMDAHWRYGAAPSEIFATIMHGRPNGMPAFRGRIPEQQAWQLVLYVRAMSGQVRADALPGRSDSLGAVEPEVRRDRVQPEPPKGPPA